MSLTLDNSDTKIVAILPMRHDSQRVIGKNYRLLGKKPLYTYILDTLLQVPEISEVIIDTNSPIILSSVKLQYGDMMEGDEDNRKADDSGKKNIVLMERPENMCAPNVSMNRILLSVMDRLPKRLKEVKNLIILQTHATNPFVDVATISAGIRMYLSKMSVIDSLMTVTPFRKRLWIDTCTGANHNPAELLQTQDLKPWYEENSCFYIFSRKSLVEHENRLGGVTEFFEIPALQAFDIDTNDEFTIAEAFQKLRDEHVGGGGNGSTNGGGDGGNDDAVPKVHSDDYILGRLRETFHKELLMATKSNNPFVGSSLLISAPYMMANINAFVQFYNDLGVYVQVANVKERLDNQQVKEYRGSYDVALIGDDAFDGENVRECGARALCKWGTGIDSIDLNACAKYGIMVENTPNAFSVPVAESVLASIFAFNRGLLESSNKMHYSDKWVKIPSKTMQEITVGIVGMGNVGKTLADKLYKLDCQRILGYDILRIKAPGAGVKMMDDLYQMIRECDYVCICCDFNRVNYHMVNTAFINCMKSGSVLINMARGKLVDESALANGLLTGHLRGAALDVFEDEPLSESSVFRRMPNVLLNSHNANSSPLYWEKIHINTIRNSLKYLQR